MPHKPRLDPETLRRLYWDEGMSLSQVAEVVGRTVGNVANTMNRHAIPRRPPGGQQRKP